MELKYYINNVEVTENEFRVAFYEETKERRIKWFNNTWNESVKQKVEEDMKDFFEIELPKYIELQGFAGRQSCENGAKHYFVKLKNENLLKERTKKAVELLRKSYKK